MTTIEVDKNTKPGANNFDTPSNVEYNMNSTNVMNDIS
jgi:hypothetical protein